MRTIVALTKVDELDTELKLRPELIYKSTKTLEMCKKASESLGVPLMDVYPVKNYNSERDPNINVSLTGWICDLAGGGELR